MEMASGPLDIEFWGSKHLGRRQKFGIFIILKRWIRETTKDQIRRSIRHSFPWSQVVAGDGVWETPWLQLSIFVSFNCVLHATCGPPGYHIFKSQIHCHKEELCIKNRSLLYAQLIHLVDWQGPFLLNFVWVRNLPKLIGCVRFSEFAPAADDAKSLLKGVIETHCSLLC